MKKATVALMTQEFATALEGEGIKSIRMHLQAGARVDARNEDQQTPLHLVSGRWRDPVAVAKIVQLLVDSGAPINAVDEQGETPLHHAVYGLVNKQPVVDVLIKNGADVNARNAEGETPLHAALRQGFSPEIVEALLNAGASPNAIDDSGTSIVQLAADSVEALDLLKSVKANLFDRDADREALIRKAVLGDESHIDWLVSAGLELNGKDAAGCTPLHLLASSISSDERLDWGERAEKTTKAVLSLIEHGADPRFTDDRGDTPALHAMYACADAFANEERKRWRGEKGLKFVGVARILADGGSTLFEALLRGDQTGIQAQIRAGHAADTTGRGWTAIHVAAFAGADPESIQALLAAGAPLDARTPEGVSAVMMALNQFQGEAAQALVDAGADLSFTVADKVASPLWNAARIGNVALFKAFVPHATRDQQLKALGDSSFAGTAKVEACKALLAAGVPAPAFEFSPLVMNAYAASGEERRAIVDFAASLLSAGCLPNLDERAQARLYAMARDGDGALAANSRALLLGCIAKGMKVKVEGLWDLAKECRIKGYSVLHKAVEDGDLEMVRAILATGEALVMPSESGSSSWTYGSLSPLVIAVEKDDPAIVRALLDAGDRIATTDMIEHARQCCRSVAVSDLFAGAEMGSPDDAGGDAKRKMEMLFDAVRNGKKELVADLLKRGVSADSVVQGQPLLVAAAGEWSDEILEMILDAGANPNAQDASGDTALHQAATRSRFVERLLKARADPNLCNSRGESPLVALVRQRGHDRAALKALIASGAKLDLQEREGRTALMFGADDPAVVATLLKAGASTTIRDRENRNALGHAVNAKTKAAFIAAGMDPNDCGKDLLALALSDGDIGLSILLLEKGASLRNCRQLSETGIACLDRVAGSNPGLLEAQASSLPDAERAFVEDSLRRKAPRIPVATEESLPAVLREGGWPVRAPKRTPIVIQRPLSLTGVGFEPKLEWSEGEVNEILERHGLSTSTPKEEKEGEAALMAATTDAKGRFEFSDLLHATTFVEFWNARGAEYELRLRWAPYTPWTDDLKLLLARYGLAILPGMLRLATKKPGVVIQALRRVNATECALLMSKAIGGGTGARAARQWLLAHADAAAWGLVGFAVGKVGRDRDTAEAALRYLATKGSRATVEHIAAELGPDVSKALAEVLSIEAQTDFMPKAFPRMPTFWAAGDHPAPRLIGSGLALPLSAINVIAGMMSISTIDAPTPALEEVKAACDRESLANFSWSMFESWTRDGNNDSKWMYQALGYFGDDNCARRLTPQIRDWPKAGGMANAILGLDILAAIGSDAALAEVQSIALKCNYPKLQKHAQATLEAIAAARELNAEQLGDRIVPTLELGEDGACELPFGTRSFVGRVDEQLRPRLFDGSGSIVKDLPKRGKADDAKQVKQSTEAWARFCKELKPVTKLQLARLERAMIDGRRWSAEEFGQLLVRHPLLQTLVRGLVWGVFSDDDVLLQSFRVTAAGAYTDIAGKPVTIPEDAKVGIPHPLTLEDARDPWKAAFAKDKQGQPFPQLVRKTYRPDDDEDGDLFGLQGATVPSKALKGLKALGWDAPLLGAADVIECFRSGAVEISVEPGVALTNFTVLSEEQTLRISLPSLSDVEYSEVIRELQTLKT